MPQVPVRPSLAITTGSMAAVPSSKSEIMPGLAAQPLRPGGMTTVPPPPVPEPPVLPLAPPVPGPEPPVPPMTPMHVPAEHVWPVAHGLPQPPQFATSVMGSTHAVPQSVFVHVLEHMLFVQNGLSVVQIVPHAPQLLALVFVSTQTPLHVVYAHCAGAEPPELLLPPVPVEVPLPPAPGSNGCEVDEQLTAKRADDPSVSEAPTNFARNVLDFGRNRFHIRTPNLFKVGKVAEQRPPTAQLNVLHSVPTVARQSARESSRKSTLSLKLALSVLESRDEVGKNASKLLTNLSLSRRGVALSMRL